MQLSVVLAMSVWTLAKASTNELSEGLPVFELGAGGTAQSAPDYPGSDEYHLHGLPFPYMVYRGSVLKSDPDRGTRAEFFADDIVLLDVSFAGSYPVSRDSNQARRGMRETVDWVGEAGPRTSIRLWRGEDRQTLRFQMAARGVASTDLARVRDIGYILEPQLAWVSFHGPQRQWRISAAVSAAWTDRRLANYFYEVQEYDVAPGRPRYDAQAGYLGSSVSSSITYAYSPQFRIIFGPELGFFGGSANQTSPLFRKSESIAFSVAIIWVMYHSEKKFRY